MKYFSFHIWWKWDYDFVFIIVMLLAEDNIAHQVRIVEYDTALGFDRTITMTGSLDSVRI